jgi:hypothetical protein
MGFESPSYSLHDLLKWVAAGEVQLPNFQRPYKWDEDRISSLLASISRGYPIGVITALETGGEGSVFDLHVLDGVDRETASARPSLMLIDGQQRLTSLFQSLLSNQPARTREQRGADTQRWFYVDMNVALADDDDRWLSIKAVPSDRKVREDFGRRVKADYSTMDLECRAEMFPLSLALDPNGQMNWALHFIQLSPNNLQRWQLFKARVIDPIVEYRVPVIKLLKSTPPDAVCTVFEKVNEGGLPLTAFELLTARLAKSTEQKFSLAGDWQRIRKGLLRQDVLKEFATPHGNPAFLQAVCLLATWKRRMAAIAKGDPTPPAISCRRSDMLLLTHAEYMEWRDRLVDALKWVGQFLHKEYVFHSNDIPYPSQLVPLAAIRAVIGSKIDNHGNYGKIRRWYWCGVLGELYGGTIESRFARDMEQVVAWIGQDAPEPDTVASARFHENRLLTLSTRVSAAYKGLYALIMKSGSVDWLYHQGIDFATVNDLKIDVHHIFPRAWCAKRKINRRQYDCIVNKTAISLDANRFITDNGPSVYLPMLESRAKIDTGKMDEIVATHQIAAQHLRRDDFDGFYEDRANRLLKLIGEAMGKDAVRRREVPKGDDPNDFPDETPDLDDSAD